MIFRPLGFLRQMGTPCILEIPDGPRFLRRDQKNRKHFYFEGPSQMVSDVGDFYDECKRLSGTAPGVEKT